LVISNAIPMPASSVRAFVLRVVASESLKPGDEIRLSASVTVGRERTAGLWLDDRSVSRQHAQLEPAADGVRVRDLGSGNGVWMGAERIADRQLTPGQQFRIGATVFEVRSGAGEVPSLAPVGPTARGTARPPEAPAAAGGLALRVVEGSATVQVGHTYAVSGDLATLGRSETCDIVVGEKDVSRRHARVERTPEGLRIVDLDSAGGVWVGTEAVKNRVLRPGERVRLGRAIVLELVADGGARTPAPAVPAPAPPPPAKPSAPPAVPPAPPPLVKPVTPPAAPSAPPVARTPAPADVPAVTRPHAVAPPAPPKPPPPAPAPPKPAAPPVAVKPPAPAPPVPPRPLVPAPAAASDATQYIVAPGHTSAPDRTQQMRKVVGPGVDLEGTQVLSREALDATRTGGTGFFRRPDALSSGDHEVGHTFVMPAVAGMAEKARRIEEEGEPIDVSAHRPFLLDDPDSVYYVIEGGLLIFTVALEKGAPVGQRTHFLGIGPGQCCFGFDLKGYALGSGFLVVPKQGSKVRRMPVARLQQLARMPQQGEAVAALLDTWVGGLSKALTPSTAKRTGELPLKPGVELKLDRTNKATSADGVVWVDLWSGSVLFDDVSTLVFPRKRAFFPITPDSWIRPLGDEFGALVLNPKKTSEVVSDGTFWLSLQVFHRALCECEFVNKKLANVDEYVRLQAKAHHKEAAEEAAYDAIGAVMRTESDTPRELLDAVGSEPVLKACALVGHAIGIEVRGNPGATEDLAYEEQVAAIAASSGFRTRLVMLRDDWWNYDHGPLLGQHAETRLPVALLPKGARSYEYINPKTGERGKVDAKIGEALTPFGFTFYRPFQDGSLTVRQVIAFAARGLGTDIKWLLFTAVAIGLFGSATPYFTGKIFDEAVPQADRETLFVFGVALMFSALATAAFKFVQGVTTIRIQSRMQNSVQAAVWDRLLNLPVNFYRKYAAGDLSDRASGIDQIQELIAGAGVAAILGSLSGLFYVIQMLGYNSTLAMVAIGLTFTYVAINMVANYLQLRYQRQEIQYRGAIAGLVLNLISGVSKLRIAGAENHAFKVWAREFAQQRKISFTVGNIQNVAGVFSAIFPVMSSIAIFTIMMSEQAKAAETGEPGLSVGAFIAFNSAYGLFLGAMQALGDASLNLLRIIPIYERIIPILETPPEVDRSKGFPGRLSGAIDISHVTFRYTQDGPAIVRDLSLKIKAGEFVAFVGSSGCGKSTLMRLMLGFEAPASGTIYFDGQDLSSIDVRMLRQQMGVVLQVSRVMPTEIFRNICGASSRTLEDAWEAAEKSGLAEDIRNMPMGMHTYVSEGGGTLSGGQRQRLMIARAIVNKPKIIFLDEATSALDNRTQQIVSESMDRMEATRIVIAHRLSTIINADKICYLEAGQIIEQGTYAELMEKDGAFAALAKRQMV
jgi:NHLM bacteriocin system ABC transporter ATP-binding protein